MESSVKGLRVGTHAPRHDRVAQSQFGEYTGWMVELPGYALTTLVIIAATPPDGVGTGRPSSWLRGRGRHNHVTEQNLAARIWIQVTTALIQPVPPAGNWGVGSLSPGLLPRPRSSCCARRRGRCDRRHPRHRRRQHSTRTGTAQAGRRRPQARPSSQPARSYLLLLGVAMSSSLLLTPTGVAPMPAWAASAAAAFGMLRRWAGEAAPVGPLAGGGTAAVAVAGVVADAPLPPSLPSPSGAAVAAAGAQLSPPPPPPPSLLAAAAAAVGVPPPPPPPSPNGAAAAAEGAPAVSGVKRRRVAQHVQLVPAGATPADSDAGGKPGERRVRRTCKHGRRRYLCKECGGASICEHGRVRYDCRDCIGSCLHGRLLRRCRDCRTAHAADGDGSNV